MEPTEAHLIRSGDLVLHNGQRRTVATVTVVIELVPTGSSDKVDELIAAPTQPIIRVGGLTAAELEAVDEISALIDPVTRTRAA